MVPGAPSWSSSQGPTPVQIRPAWAGRHCPGTDRAPTAGPGSGRRELRGQLVVGVQRERQQHRLGAHVVAVGVVVGPGLPKVGERRHDVGRVVTEVFDLFLGRVELLDQLRERRRRDPRQRRCGQRQLGEVAGAGPVVDEAVQRADGGDRFGNQPAQRRQELPAAGGPPAWTPPPADRAGSGSSGDRRTSWSSAGACSGSRVSACWSAWLCRAMAPVAVLVLAINWVSWVLRAASACRAWAPWTTSPSNTGWSRVSSAGHLARALQSRRQVFQCPVRRLALALQ